MKVSKLQIDRSSHEELTNIREALHTDKMKLDKFFTVFLESVKLDSDDLDNPEWTVYHEMLKSYEQLTSQIQYCDYRLRNPSFAK